ncbi:mucin-binding protein [Lactovum odontotermitis]
MIGQHGKSSKTTNTCYRAWKKGKSWCYSFSVLAVLAGSTQIVQKSADADVIASTVSSTSDTTNAAVLSASASTSTEENPFDIVTTADSTSTIEEDTTAKSTSTTESSGDKSTPAVAPVTPAPASALDAVSADITLLTGYQTVNELPSDTALKSNQFQAIGVKGDFTVNTSELTAGNTIVIAKVIQTSTDPSAMVPFLGVSLPVDLLDGGKLVGTIQYDAAKQAFTLIVANTVTDGANIKAYHFETAFMGTINEQTPSSVQSKMPFSNTILVSGHEYTFDFTKISTQDATKIQSDGLSLANNAGSGNFNSNLNHEVVPDDTAFMQLQESNGATGTVLENTGIMKSLKISSESNLAGFGATILYSGTYYVSAATGKIQSTTDMTYIDRTNKVISYSPVNAGDYLTLAELQAKATRTGAYYSLQKDGTYFFVQYVSPEDTIMTDAEIEANVRISEFAAVSSDVDADVKATLAYYHGVLKNRATNMIIASIFLWEDQYTANTITVKDLDDDNSQTLTSVPNSVAAAGQSTIKVHYEDENGNVLAPADTTFGWPAGNSMNMPATPDLSIKPKEIAGYTYKTVNGVTAGADGSASVTYPSEGETTDVFYIYAANNQKVVYNVIDDTDKKNLATSQDFASGKSDANLPDTAQTDYDAIIKSYTDQGYELVPETTDPVPGVFDHDDADQVINIHLKHGTTTQEVTENVTRTVHYIVEGDLCEAPEDVKDTVYFTRTETRDSVSNAVIDAGQWTSDDACCDAVVSPKLENFTADTLVVPTIETVKPEDDDTTVNVLYTASLETTTETKNITETIHYVYEDGSEAAPDKTDKVSFTREVTTNLATGEVTYGAWTAENGDTRFDAVTSPLIDGYTVDKLSVDAVTGLTADSEDAVTTVTYKKDAADPAPTPDPTDTPTTPSSTPKTTITVQPTSQTTKKSVLPSTGDEQRSMITVAGGITVLGAGLLAVITRLRRRNR